MTFEGPEKRLLLSTCEDLRKLTRENWQKILDHAKCTIIDAIVNQDCTFYLLSESSLLVAENFVMIKTCGTTTLLNILPIIKHCELVYSHHDFIFPDMQELEYKSFNTELDLIPMGNTYSYYNYPRFNLVNTGLGKNYYLEIMMTGLADSKRYYSSNNLASIRRYLSPLTLGHEQVSDFLFEPCGYSSNTLNKGEYTTIHITPEDSCSYASYETNSRRNYKDLIHEALFLFKPKQWIAVVFDSGKIRYFSDDTIT